jgi:hypothetical protein
MAIICYEVGLVQAISVKVGLQTLNFLGVVTQTLLQEHLSAKHKEMFKTIQLHGGENSTLKQLILDMKVQWSSTYMMLHCVYSLQKVWASFVYCIGPILMALSEC